MALLVRVFAFLYGTNRWWLLGCPAVLGVVAWWHHEPLSLTILLGGSAVAFIAPFFARRPIILYYATAVRGLKLGWIVLIVGLGTSGFLGYGKMGAIAFAVCCTFTLGVLFWSTTDALFQMVSWLVFPTEYGRRPDEIFLVDRRRVSWPDQSELVECCLFRFRYDDEWNSGITGPITFSLDQDDEGKPPAEIYASYAQWYAHQGIEKLLQEGLEGQD